MTAAQVGVVGLAVMGRNLSRNLVGQGRTVAVYDRIAGLGAALVAEHGGEGALVDCATPEELVAVLDRPRVVIVMVPAGTATDEVIGSLTGLLEPGDTVIDAGNAHFQDTRRREEALETRGLHFIGSGVSGGEEGALNGLSIMVGGSAESYAALTPLFEAISARVDGEPCCSHVGPDGAGHFVKMVHNGIEYADLQLIGEAYHLLRVGLGANPAEIGDIFARWNEGDLESYLIEIPADVLHQVDAKTGRPLVDVILDEARQKGTGRWAVQSGLDLGVPVTGIAEATFARALSSERAQREAVRTALGAAEPSFAVEDRDAFIEDVRLALYASKVVAYAQGFDQIQAGSEEYGWNIDRGAMARIWRGGCIIRARFLGWITEAYHRDPTLASLLADPYFAKEVARGVAAWRRVVCGASLGGVPVPALSSSLSYYDALRSERLPAALIQAQRDFFGAHSYQRVDVDGSFHTLWSSDRSETEV
ncbi:MAG: NADP-dependent phosphogluconate dehydrogenase [Demequinaceae bacterium]|nr:NADP-dependent phosphogluconate dehydrogenase [Demequinaceae bacterium]